MSKIEEFLNEEQEAEVVAAIRKAESHTSGEIRVHIEKTSNGNIWDRAMEVFHLLKMDNTKEDNGVLIYVAIDDRQFVIYGDKGINKVVPKDFWETTKDAIASSFKKGDFKQGLIDGILIAGKELQEHFPWSEGDKNELSNKIST
ncbi:TPM domain-containing protein [Salinimicrobium sediminilitoris]|uniref:TPM domain-containing protein n=1 Tax=Salinimicrobium sediminilitoris TaxID=2876715 RepID=UPI001E4EF03C|nr:TPM domain-containing protein [Salinimicrobium sediminilitoris]MCC8359978.1 TPM domain-containing protein [Salinimicrobium sediminilitoris]